MGSDDAGVESDEGDGNDDNDERDESDSSESGDDVPRGLNLNDGVPAKSLPKRAFDAGLAAKYPRINAPPKPNARGYIFDIESDDAMPCTMYAKLMMMVMMMMMMT